MKSYTNNKSTNKIKLIKHNIKPTTILYKKTKPRIPLSKYPNYLNQVSSNTINHTKPKQTLVNNSITQMNSSILNSSLNLEKLLYNSTIDENEKIEKVKLKIKLVEEKAKEKEIYLQLNGGAEKHPELGEEISQMLLSTINAKLELLNYCKKYRSKEKSNSK